MLYMYNHYRMIWDVLSLVVDTVDIAHISSVGEGEVWSGVWERAGEKKRRFTQCPSHYYRLETPFSNAPLTTRLTTFGWYVASAKCCPPPLPSSLPPSSPFLPQHSYLANLPPTYQYLGGTCNVCVCVCVCSHISANVTYLRLRPSP